VEKPALFLSCTSSHPQRGVAICCRLASARDEARWQSHTPGTGTGDGCLWRELQEKSAAPVPSTWRESDVRADEARMGAHGPGEVQSPGWINDRLEAALLHGARMSAVQQCRLRRVSYNGCATASELEVAITCSVTTTSSHITATSFTRSDLYFNARPSVVVRPLNMDWLR
jgi:hypothetical protein